MVSQRLNTSVMSLTHFPNWCGAQVPFVLYPASVLELLCDGMVEFLGVDFLFFFFFLALVWCWFALNFVYGL